MIIDLLAELLTDMNILYYTGAILIKTFTFGIITYPIGHIREEKQDIKYGWICYLVGFVFYMLIVILAAISLVKLG